jgi:hypothetical protein
MILQQCGISRTIIGALGNASASADAETPPWVPSRQRNRRVRQLITMR